MEEYKKTLIGKGLSLRSEEVNEVMGKFPHHIFRVGTLSIVGIVVLLAVIGHMLQIPSYIEVPYIVLGNISSTGIMAKNTGTVIFRHTQLHNVEMGDTIATVMQKNGERVYYISPAKGIVESDFLYTTGDNVTSGDTLARVISCEKPRYRLILKIPLNMRSKVENGMKIRITPERTTVDNAVGYIKRISMIPDGSNCYNAIVEMPIDIIQNIPTAGEAKLYYKTENVFKKILTTR